MDVIEELKSFWEGGSGGGVGGEGSGWMRTKN